MAISPKTPNITPPRKRSRSTRAASPSSRTSCRRAEVIDVSKLGGDTIKFGATVTLIDEDTEEEKIYQIVGETEADVKSGKVSITLADRARADRQEGRRHRRGQHARRRQELRSRQRRLPLRDDLASMSRAIAHASTRASIHECIRSLELVLRDGDARVKPEP